jgi:beta-galactosidase
MSRSPQRISRRTAIQGALGAAGALWAGSGESREVAATRIPTALTLRSRARFNDGWKFSLGDPAGAGQTSFDDSGWRNVGLPHDWSIEGPFDQNNPSGVYGGYMPAGVGWYRKTFTPPALSNRQQLLIEFEGIYRYGQVWLNGRQIGTRPNGFVSVQYDLTPFLAVGKPNVLAVRVDNTDQPNLRWYSGSGIYRHVWLTVADQVRVDYGGTYITTPLVSAGQATVRVVTTLVNSGAVAAAIQLDTQIFDPSGRKAGHATSTQTIPAGKMDVTQDFTVASPLLWSPDDPKLYCAYSTVRQGGLGLDDYFSSFGIREVRFDKDSGLLVNGQNLKLKGLCIHHDLGCLGTAAHDRAIERRLRALQSLGCNAVRVGHNPPAPHLLDLCDRMGLLVIDEAFDKWLKNYPEGDFSSPGWTDWWQEDLRAMLVRDRNHPSIILWSVGNEAGLPGDPGHDATLQQLVSFVHNEEPSRPVTCALEPQTVGFLEDFANNVALSARYVDVLAVNYQEQYLDLYRAKLPNLAVVATESYPFFHGITNGFDTYNNWWEGAKRNFDAGQFVWVGVDYLGETAGWPSKGWPNGLIDTCGYLKARSAFNQTVWQDAPSVRISVISASLDVDLGLAVWRWPKSAAHWNFKGLEGQVLQIDTVSNCDTVELLVNGQSWGQQKPHDFQNWTISWFPPYAPGTLEAVGRNGGVVVSRHLLQTAGPAARIVLHPDRNQISADGLDLSHIEVSLVDANGILVPDQDARVTFSINGPARLIGVDNGDLRSLESYQANSRTTYWGRALAIVQSTGASGQIVVAASSAALPNANASVMASDRARTGAVERS